MDQSSNTQKMESWNESRLLAFIQDNLQNPLPADEKKLLDARIDGSAFLEDARDRTIFKEAGLAVGLCANLSKLARTIVLTLDEAQMSYHHDDLLDVNSRLVGLPVRVRMCLRHLWQEYPCRSTGFDNHTQIRCFYNPATFSGLKRLRKVADDLLSVLKADGELRALSTILPFLTAFLFRQCVPFLFSFEFSLPFTMLCIA